MTKLRVTEYHMERSEDVLTLHRTKAWYVRALFGSLFPLAGAIVGGWALYQRPRDLFSMLLYTVALCFMVFVFYKLVIWGRSLVFDKPHNCFSINGQKVCALSDMISVRLEGSQRDFRSPDSGRLRGVVFQRAHGKDIPLKYAWEDTPEYVSMTEMAKAISIFVGIPYNIRQ